MDRKVLIVFLALLLAVPVCRSLLAQEKSEEIQAGVKKLLPLSDKHNEWLEEEVVYIISNPERDAFMELESDQARDQFIEAFWLSRDPTPGTEMNEFREEHYERIKRANYLFGRDTSKPGWKTDRGKMWVLFGEPRFRSNFHNEMLIQPAELWHYLGDMRYGLPPSFYLVFFRPYGVGEMRLYSPTLDGINKLFKPLHYVQGMNEEALTEIMFREVDPELSHAVWSFIPSEGGLATQGFMPNPLASEMLLARIEDARNYPLNYEWVNSYMAHRTEVTVEYTFQHTTPRTLFVWLQNPQGLMEMHYAVSLKSDQFTLGRYREKVYGSVTLEGFVNSSEGELIAPIRQHSEFDLSPSQLQSINNRPFEFQGLLPIIPGDFNLALMWKNDVARRHVSIMGELEVPDIEDITGPVLTPPILVNSISPLEEGEVAASVRPFQVGSYQISPNLRGVVSPGTRFSVFMQMVLPPATLLRVAEYHLEYRLFKKGELIKRHLNPLGAYTRESELRASIGILVQIETSDLPSEEYSLRFLLLKGEEEVSRSSDIAVTISGEQELGPWVIRRGMPPYTKGHHSLARAEQWMRRGDQSKARDMLRKAVYLDPSMLNPRFTLMRLLLRERQFEEVISLGEPLLVERPRDIQLLLYTASGYMGRGRTGDAIRLLDRVLSEQVDNLAALNLLAYASHAEGDLGRALEAIKKSLEIHPDQPDIIKLKSVVEGESQE